MEPLTEQTIRPALQQDLEKEHFEDYPKWYKENFSDDLILIYCCHECSSVDCGGVGVKVDQKNDTIIGTFFENEKRRTKGKTLQFHFDKSQYYGVFNKYRKAFIKNKDTRK